MRCNIQFTNGQALGENQVNDDILLQEVIKQFISRFLSEIVFFYKKRTKELNDYYGSKTLGAFIDI